MSPSTRAHQRHEIALPVQMLYKDRRSSGLSRNLSMGGMFVVCEADIPFGASLELTFEIETLDRPIVTQAVVRWVEAGLGVGVGFQGLRAHEVWSLQQLFSVPASQASP